MAPTLVLALKLFLYTERDLALEQSEVDEASSIKHRTMICPLQLVHTTYLRQKCL